MISKKLEDALNEQINKEFYSAYLYLGMAAHFESEGLKGFAKWMRVQALEEQGHAMKLYDYLFSVDAKPVLKAIKEAPVHYEKPPVEVIQEVLKHEQYVTASINSLYELALALKLLLSHKVRKLILTRPVVEAGESLGFLPGDLVQKINPYLRPLFDIMETLLPADVLRSMEESNTIEVAPLAYMRGRTLHNAVVILDEAQNTTKEQMKMFLTRMGEGSKLIITGDPSQSDIRGKAESGLVHAVSLIRTIDGIGTVEFSPDEVVRHSLVQKIINAYEKQ